MERITIQAQPRHITGRKVKSLRRQGLVPAVIYGHGFNSLPIQVPLKEFERVYTEAGETTIVYLNLEGKEYPTIIQDVAKDPISDELLHADFYKVRLDEKIKARIPLNFVGESPAVKNLGGILVKNISEIEVEGFPQDLPHHIDVDISSLKELKSQILIKDLPVSKKLKVEADPAAIVVLVQEPISEEELKAQLETPTAPSAEEVEVIKKEKAKEEAPAAEETTPAGKIEEKAEEKK